MHVMAATIRWVAQPVLGQPSLKKEVYPMDSPLSPAFIIGTIRIGTIEGASCLNMGNNWPTNFRSFKKHNQGFGTVKGNQAHITGTRSLLNDPDLIDFPTFNDQDLPGWLKQMLGKGDSPAEGFGSEFLDNATDANAPETPDGKFVPED